MLPHHYGYLRDMQMQVGVNEEVVFWFLGHQEGSGKG